MAGKQVRRLCCPAAVRGARPKQELGRIDCADSASWTHRLFFDRSVATGKPGRPEPRGEPSQKIRHGGCVLLAKDERDGCNIRAFLARRMVPLDSARERAEFFWIFARLVRELPPALRAKKYATGIFLLREGGVIVPLQEGDVSEADRGSFGIPAIPNKTSCSSREG